MIHEALAGWYIPGRARGLHPAVTFNRLYNAQPEQFNQWDDEGNKIPALDLGIEMCEGYVREYGKDDHIEIIAPEMSLEVDVFDSAGNYVCTWVGRGDALYKDLARSSRSNPKVGFLEHKTAKTMDQSTSIISGYGEQGLSYWWAGSIVMQHLGVLPEGAQIDHVLFNWLRKGIPSTKPRNARGMVLNQPKKDALLKACSDAFIDVPRKAKVEDLWELLKAEGIDPVQYGEVSKVQPSPLFHRDSLDYGSSAKEEINKRIRLEAGEMARVRSGKLPIYKNPTKDCKWDCPFHAPCEVHEMGADFRSILELEFQDWDPYDGHELLEEKGR
jgi:hypothetical protein